MRIFHVSEQADIRLFVPRRPTREDLDQQVGLVWAIDEARLPNYLLPRNCPRVTYHVGPQTTAQDQARFFSSSTLCHAVVVERGWLKRIQTTTLWLYEFDPSGFAVQDEIAGYYVATTPQRPVRVLRVDDLLAVLLGRGVELRFVDNLWELADQVQHSSLNFSFCRMSFAQPRQQ